MNPAPAADSFPWRRGFSRCLAALGGLVVLAGLFVLRIHPFLAVTAPVKAPILVVEGWVPDYALERAVEEFRSGGYERVFTTGGAIGAGAFLSQHGSYAERAAASLLKMGLTTNQVTAVPSGALHRNRTFGSAAALRDHFLATGQEVSALNIVSVGAHARRSRLCFQRAFGSGVAVGVFAVEDRGYDPNRWWLFSEGVKTALGEPIGFVYAWLAVDYGK